MLCCFTGGKSLPLDPPVDKLTDSEKIQPVPSDTSSCVKAVTLPTSTDVSSLGGSDSDGKVDSHIVFHSMEDSSKPASGNDTTRDVIPPTQPTNSGAATEGVQEEDSLVDELFQGMAVSNTASGKPESTSPAARDELFKNMSVENITGDRSIDALFKNMGKELVVGDTPPRLTLDELFQGIVCDIMTKNTAAEHKEEEIAAPDFFQSMGVAFTTSTFVPVPAVEPTPDTAQDRMFKHMAVEISMREPLRPLPNHPPVEPEVAVPAPEPTRPGPSPWNDALFQHLACDVTCGITTKVDLEAVVKAAEAAEAPADPFWMQESITLIVGDVLARQQHGFTIPPAVNGGTMSLLQKAVDFVHDVVDPQESVAESGNEATTATPVQKASSPALAQAKTKKSRSKKKRSLSMKKF